MRAERDSMTGMDVHAPALGGEERSDEAPRAEATRVTPAPDSEVMAKPTRRQFTAVYRLRLLEEAHGCTRSGELGRLLRREWLYTSHLSAWRKARRNGSLQGLTPNKHGTKPAQSNPLSAKVARLEQRTRHRAHDSRSAGKSCRAAGIQPHRREGLLMAATSLATRVGVPSAGRPGQRSTTVTGPFLGASSPERRPPGPWMPPNAGTSSTCSSACASSTARPRRSLQRSSTKGNPYTRRARCIASWAPSSRCENGAISSPTRATAGLPV